MEPETCMHTDMLPDFLHLFHGLGALGGSLPGLLGRFDNNPRLLRQADPAKLAKMGFRRNLVERIAKPRQREVDRDLAWAEAVNNRLICFDDDAYPAILSQINDLPALLYASGDAALLLQPQVSIVGSRRCTPGGAQTAFDFASQLAGAGLAITSGLALGIDAAAHRGALQASGATLAVLGTGIDILYPVANRRLADEIRERGLILSECPPPELPRRRRISPGVIALSAVFRWQPWWSRLPSAAAR
jgi:DNA processing protein